LYKILGSGTFVSDQNFALSLIPAFFNANVANWQISRMLFEKFTLLAYSRNSH